MIFSNNSEQKSISVCKKSVIDSLYTSFIRLVGLFLISLRCYADGGMSSLGGLAELFIGAIILGSALTLYLSYYIYKKDKDNNKVACTMPIIILVVILINIWS